MDPWLVDNLVCPRDTESLSYDRGRLVCSEGHSYPCPQGIPVMLVEDSQPTHRGAFGKTHELVASLSEPDGAIGPEALSPPGSETSDNVDQFVQANIGNTCGLMYWKVANKLKGYPLPDLPLPVGSGQLFLDVGCNWGRWCISAAKKGYLPVGVDPSLEGVAAARRVARQLGVTAHYVVADARHLPFRSQAFDVAFSYSVFMHLHRADVLASVAQIARVVKTGGTSFVQIPNKFGPRNLMIQARRGFKNSQDRSDMSTRYWTRAEMKREFSRLVGATELVTEGFFYTSSGGISADARAVLPARYRLVLSLSEVLKQVGDVLPLVQAFADSIYVKSVKAPEPSRLDTVSSLVSGGRGC